ncbi:MAG: helix-turn-helix domain-containing protein [Candidatus Diapherotrites archaeon]|nr:helix-turn-helix domain-containing protein [Candidatus Diapherotrites archaeon]
MTKKEDFKIIIKKVEKPFDNTPYAEMNWICESFGFFGSGPRLIAGEIFKRILQETENGRGISSTELAKQLGLSRGSVIHHLNNLVLSGLVVKRGRHYFARSKSIYRILDELEEEIEFLFQRMKKVAKKIDESFGIEINDSDF